MPDVVSLLTDREVATISYGSKAQLAAWYTYTALICTFAYVYSCGDSNDCAGCMKFMLLFFYRRLMMGTTQARFINYLFWICSVTYIAVFMTVTFGCHPYVKQHLHALLLID
jgi:hypothetical protein